MNEKFPSPPKQGENETNDVDGEHAVAITELIEHAEELGLSPEETTEAVEDYKEHAGLVGGKVVQDAVETLLEDGDPLSAGKILADPASLPYALEQAKEAGPDAFAGVMESLEKTEASIGELQESLKGLGETFEKLLELLNAVVELLKEIEALIKEREAAESAEEKEQISDEIQEKIDAFAATWDQAPESVTRQQ